MECGWNPRDSCISLAEGKVLFFNDPIQLQRLAFIAALERTQLLPDGQQLPLLPPNYATRGLHVGP
jgi:hypothetical protein